MEKKDIVSLFLKEGYQLAPSSLDFFSKNPEKMQKFLGISSSISEKDKASLLTADKIASILSSNGMDNTKYSIIKEFSIDVKKKKTSTSEYASLFTRRYDRIRTLLTDRMAAMKTLSLNKAKGEREFSVIVMVREKITGTRSLLIEDPTGEMTVRFPESIKEFDEIIEDDVIGLRCRTDSGGLIAESVVWPDIPLNREINKAVGEVNVIFVSNVSKDSPKYEKLQSWIDESSPTFVISPSKLTFDKGITSIIQDSDIGFFSIEGVSILSLRSRAISFYSDLLKKSTIQDTINSILRRGGDVSIQEEVNLPSRPDIVVAWSGTASFTNYKGTTIITVPDFEKEQAVMIANLSSREINKFAM